MIILLSHLLACFYTVSVAIISPLETSGYQCVAKGSLSDLPTLTDEQLWELNKGFDRPSISIRSAEVVDQSLLDIHLVHGKGVTSKAGSLQLLVRIIQIKPPPVEPNLQYFYNPPLTPEVRRESSPASPTACNSETPEPYSLMEGLNLYQGPTEVERASVQSSKGKVTRMPEDKTLPSYIETDPDTGFEHERRLRSSLRSSVNTSLGVSLDIHGGIRWRNPNDIEWKPPVPQNVQYRTYDNSKDEHNFRPFASRQNVDYNKRNVRNLSSTAPKNNVNRKKQTLVGRRNQSMRDQSKKQEGKQLISRGVVDDAFKKALQVVKIAQGPNIDLLLPSEEADKMGIKFNPHLEETSNILDTSFDSVTEIHNEQLQELFPQNIGKIPINKNKQQKSIRSKNSHVNNSTQKNADMSRTSVAKGNKVATPSSTVASRKQQYEGDSEKLLQNLSPPPPPPLMYSKALDGKIKK